MEATKKDALPLAWKLMEHTDKTDNGSSGSTLQAYCSSSGGGGDNTQASTSLAGMEEAAGVFRNEARNVTGTGGRELQELCGVCGNVCSRRDALHRRTNEHTRDKAHICKACVQSSLKNSKFVEHCPSNTGKNRKCETCGELSHLTDQLSEHYRPRTDGTPYRCEGDLVGGAMISSHGDASIACLSCSRCLHVYNGTTVVPSRYSECPHPCRLVELPCPGTGKEGEKDSHCSQLEELDRPLGRELCKILPA
ncbi:zinc finger protein 26-like [Dermacentor albipictus]|uniref:zinc finger protein 26-like n=1 Tax=Dermacentor albipictus TaxID=60249 RepID=UPI0038FCD231